MRPTSIRTLNVRDNEVVDIESLVVGVRFRVLQERQKEFGGFLGPATLRAGGIPSLGLRVATGTANVTSAVTRGDIEIIEEEG